MLTQLLQRARGRSNPADALKALCPPAGAPKQPVTDAITVDTVNCDNRTTPVESVDTLPRRTVKLILVTAANNNKFYDWRCGSVSAARKRIHRLSPAQCTIRYMARIKTEA